MLSCLVIYFRDSVMTQRDLAKNAERALVVVVLSTVTLIMSIGFLVLTLLDAARI